MHQSYWLLHWRSRQKEMSESAGLTRLPPRRGDWQSLYVANPPGEPVNEMVCAHALSPCDFWWYPRDTNKILPRRKVNDSRAPEGIEPSGKQNNLLRVEGRPSRVEIQKPMVARSWSPGQRQIRTPCILAPAELPPAKTPQWQFQGAPLQQNRCQAARHGLFEAEVI